jgi:hypothetical protein
VLDVDLQRDLASRHGDEAVFDAGEIPAHQGEQVARLGERVVPGGEMPAVAEVARVDQVAVGEKDRRFLFVGLDACRVDRHDVRTVGKIGDTAKTFGLALRAIGRARAIEAHELRVGRRVHDGLDLQREGPVRWLRNGEPVGGRRIALAGELLAVDRERGELEFVAVEHYWRRRGGVRVGLELQRRPHSRFGGVERDVELHRIDEPVGRPIVFEANGASLLGAHHHIFSSGQRKWAAPRPAHRAGRFLTRGIAYRAQQPIAHACMACVAGRAS